MNQFALKNSKISRFLFGYGNLLLAFISIIALSLTFGVASSELHFSTKVLAFAFIITTYLFIYLILQTLQRNQFVEIKEVIKKNTSKQIFESDTDEKLLVLEEAGRFFGASLKTQDMFRLVSSRIEEIIHYETCAFFQIDSNNKFSVPFATGKNSRLLESIKIECGQGIAGKAFLSRKVEIDTKLELDKDCIENKFLSGLISAIAIPLFLNDEVLGVLILYSESSNNYDESSKVLAEAIGERITPLVNGSIEYEKSLANALTDNLTNLPNERAFYLILENQVAEAQRFLERRSLTILAIDIKNFSDLNKRYGHTIGDRILADTSERIKEHIRRMDFLARTANDEFLVVLPTATGEITEQITHRIRESFKNIPISVSSKENCFIELNFGSASFKHDGETASQLLKTAIIRKHQAKTDGDNSVLFFPKKFAN